jgi:DNA repair exonuclease SbcCD ATPase subunit
LRSIHVLPKLRGKGLDLTNKPLVVEEMPEPQIVNILGEQVSLEKTDFSSAEKFLVSFEEKYKVPGMTTAEESVVKKLFLTLFSKGQTQPLPPCSEQEKELLMKSLLFRFNSLRNELIAERQSQSDSLRLRQIVDHVQRLKNYIDFAEESTECKELDEDILAESLGDLSDDQIKELLKQFVFFILQGQHPLDGFKGKDPNPKGFVARLSRKPIDNFSQFMEMYRDKKFPIPLPIQNVLEATELDVQEMKEEIDTILQDKIGEILQLIADILPPDHAFWQNLDRSNLNAIVDKLLQIIQELQDDLTDCTQQAQKDQGILLDLSAEVERLEQENQSLKTKLQLLEIAHQNIQEDSLEGNSTVELDTLRDEYERNINALKQEIEDRELYLNDLATRLEEAEKQLANQEQTERNKEEHIEALKQYQEEIETLQNTIQSLEEQLAQALEKVKACEELQSKVESLEKQVQDREEQLTELRNYAGPLTQDIDRLLQEKNELNDNQQRLELEIEAKNLFVAKVSAFIAELAQDKSVVVTLLGDIQRERAESVPSDDAVLQKIIAVRNSLNTSETVPPTLSQDITLILKDVQAEVSSKEKELDTVRKEIQTKKDQIASLQKQMDETSELVSMIRSGRADLDSKNMKFETDRDLVDAALKAVEAEKALEQEKATLQESIALLTSEKESLINNMESLEKRFQSELDSIKIKLSTAEGELVSERAASAKLKGDLAGKEEQIEQLQQEILEKETEKNKAVEDLRLKKEEHAQKVAELEESKIRDCEEKLEALRAEEEKKREDLLSVQGAEKGVIEGKIEELQKQITSVEGQRDAYKADLEVEKKKHLVAIAKYTEAMKESRIVLDRLTRMNKELEEEIKVEKEKFATTKEQVSDLTLDLTTMKSQIISDTEEKAKLYEIVTTLADWMASGARKSKPTIDSDLDRKYGFNRLIQSFMKSIPKGDQEETKSSFLASISRCNLVFFMSYIYARHFPITADADTNYQLEITNIFKSIVSEIYKTLDVPIPGKLEPIGAGGIPIQLKSKYLMNILIPLLRYMEGVHDSGKKGANFLKFSLLEEVELETLHKIHRVLMDKLKLAGGKDFLKRLNLYVKRRTGNTDDDIENLYLRFYHETKTDLEYPVIMYTTPDAKDISKFTFGTDIDFTQFLSSPAKKESVKVDSTVGKALLSNPIFSFNIVLYLFLFVVKDYLYSVEGDLAKQGCPLPQILKVR